MALERVDLETHEPMPVGTESGGHETQLRAINPRASEGFSLETKKVNLAAEIGGTLVPATLEFPADPDNIEDSRPLTIVNGYGAKKFGYDGLRAALAQHGKAAISMQPYGLQSFASRFGRDHFLHPEILLSKALYGVMRKTQDNADQYPELDVEKFDLAGHSLGLHTSTTTALHKPDMVASITNVEGVGCENSRSLWRMLGRIRPFLRHEALPAYREDGLKFEKGTLHAIRSEIDYFFPHLTQAVIRGYMAATCDNRQDLAYLKREHNIKLAAILGNRDQLIPADETVRASWGLFDYAKVIDANHLGPVTDPYVFAHEIVTCIDHLRSDPQPQSVT
ncbi:MAG: hypothetical protein U5L95_03455 [Candidatus Saccharibacteria bacterium]|nr:hypothetical protein [Candidatus Saccharibacteria bacterium]